MKLWLKVNLSFLFISLLAKTYRFRALNPDVQLTSLENNPNYIFALWHQNLIGSIYSQKNKPHAVVVSPSRDGELVATAVERLGHKVARGSSSRGGASALKKMIRLLKTDKIPGAISIDGPKGPAKEPKKGIFELAFLTNLPIIPLTVIPTSFWALENSWDKFRIPKPFSTFFIHYGAPLYLTKTDKEDEFYNASKRLCKEMEQSESHILAKISEVKAKK